MRTTAGERISEAEGGEAVSHTPDAAVDDPVTEQYERLVSVKRPALLRALDIAARGDYEDAGLEYSVLAAELAVMDRCIRTLETKRAAAGRQPELGPVG